MKLCASGNWHVLNEVKIRLSQRILGVFCTRNSELIEGRSTKRKGRGGFRRKALLMNDRSLRVQDNQAVFESAPANRIQISFVVDSQSIRQSVTLVSLKEYR